jgi:hypothetical protein
MIFCGYFFLGNDPVETALNKLNTLISITIKPDFMNDECIGLLFEGCYDVSKLLIKRISECGKENNISYCQMFFCRMVELTGITLKGLVKSRSISPIINVLRVLFPVGNKFTNFLTVETVLSKYYYDNYIINQNIQSLFVSIFYRNSGFLSLRHYLEKCFKETKLIPFDELYGILKPFKTVYFRLFFFFEDFYLGCVFY